MDDKLKNFFAKRISRGKVEVYVGMEGGSNISGAISINEPVADSYVEALKITQLEVDSCKGNYL